MRILAGSKTALKNHICLNVGIINAPLSRKITFAMQIGPEKHLCGRLLGRKVVAFRPAYREMAISAARPMRSNASSPMGLPININPAEPTLVGNVKADSPSKFPILVFRNANRF